MAFSIGGLCSTALRRSLACGAGACAPASQALVFRRSLSGADLSSRRPLTAEELGKYRTDGFVILRDVYNQEEIDLLRETVLADQMLKENVMDMVDSSGKTSRLTLWRHDGDDTYGMFSRGRRMVDFAKAATGSNDDSVYHFHTKVMLKEPHIGGRWEWHQDFGYWYEVGCLQPERMLSVMVAIDKATVQNGCLDVLKGSNRLGRIHHGNTGNQVGADPWAVDKATKLMETVPCEMDAGDVLMLHCNTLHKSNANTSDHWRRCMIVAFNTKDNEPRPDTIAPLYFQMKPVADSAIMELGMVGRASGTVEDFLQRDDNVNAFKLEDTELEYKDAK
ncbi:L-proline trans-4-hydroxylase-like [Sycon ciliatum]|uniref:L-proline trans-4-hydroxylase-like n=1 Tax=Sycon ciliatum TaxID=27933 RepID=UPI0020A887C4|eukprot:scpid5829/ scgid26698/ Ectoine hydroxylase